MIAALLVRVHQTIVQFCCKGVTGTTRARIGGVCGAASVIASIW
jgi:hypothetical protein